MKNKAISGTFEVVLFKVTTVLGKRRYLKSANWTFKNLIKVAPYLQFEALSQFLDNFVTVEVWLGLSICVVLVLAAICFYQSKQIQKLQGMVINEIPRFFIKEAPLTP